MQLNHPNRADQLEAVARSILPEGTSLAATDPRGPQPDPFPAEEAPLARAFPSRRREYCAGRAMARQAMEALGRTPEPILQAPDRAPIWPKGLAGSISHTSTLCIAALSEDLLSLGIDIEENVDLEPGLVTAICREAEIARLKGPDLLRLAKLTFCAKEAVYKAQYPLTGEMMEFTDLDLRFDFANLRFSATFSRQVGCFEEGCQLAGLFAGAADHLVTTVAIGQGD